MANQNDLIINLSSKNLINENIKKSNSIYDHYIPYFVYRRTDLKEGEKFEIVNDVTVELEFAKMNQYGTRPLCSRDHINGLINYIISKRPFLDPDNELKDLKLVTTSDRNHITMAWALLKKYIRHIFLEKLSVYVAYKKMNKNILHYIFKKDLIRFIKISFKFNYDKEIAEVYTRFIWLYNYEKENDNSDIYSFLDPSLVSRMVVYSLVGSHKGDYNELYSQALCLRFPELICSIAKDYDQLEAGMIDLSYIKHEKYFIPKILPILRNGYDISITKSYYNRFPIRDYFISFCHECLKQLKTEDEKNEFRILLCNQEFFKDLLPDKDDSDRCEYANYGTYLIYNYMEIPEINPELINENNLDFVRCISYGLIKYIQNNLSLSYERRKSLYYFIYDNLDRFIKIIEKQKESEDSEKILLMKVISTLFINPICDFSIYRIIDKLWEYDFMKEYVFNLIPEYNKFIDNNPQLPMGHYIIPDERLSEMYDRDMTAVEILKNVNIYFHLNWIKSKFGTLYVTLPIYIFNTKHIKSLSREDVEWILSNLTEEQKKTYPFNIQMMKDYPDLFKPYLSKYNIDRYIKAYGLNYVEKNIEINLSDIVNAEAYVNEQVIYRYLDIMLLSEELRSSALNNFDVCSIIAGYPKESFRFYGTKFSGENVIINQILNSDNFDNSIKCEVMLAILRKNIYCEVIFKRYRDYLVGSSYVGLSLAAFIDSNYPTQSIDGILSDNIYFIKKKVE